MSKNEKDDGKEFTFIKERILPKRKSRLKKVCISFGTTVVLAVVFGVIARVAFIVSEPLINRILGIDTNKKQVILSSSAGTSTDTGSAVIPGVTKDDDSKEENITEGLAQGQKPEKEEPSKEQDKDKVEPSSEDEESKTVNNTYYVENKIPATASDFLSMYTNLRQIAHAASKALVTITGTVTDIDTLGNPYNIDSKFPGLVVGNNGVEYLILVDYKEIKDVASVTATFAGNECVDASLQQYDKETNIAILSVRLSDLTSYAIEETVVANLGDSNVLTTGTPVMAIGSPNGFNQSMDIGAITNCSEMVYLTDLRLDLFYTNMPASQKGLGYIIDLTGDVIGIITNEFRGEEEPTLCTAISISKVKKLIEKMINGQDRVYLGIIAEDMPADQLAEAGLNFGIYVSEVASKSPAYEAGIQSGDIIITMDGKPVAGMNSFAINKDSLKYKDEIQIEIIRYNNGTPKNLELTLVVGRVK